MALRDEQEGRKGMKNNLKYSLTGQSAYGAVLLFIINNLRKKYGKET